ncbi:MAG TPA: AtpZ/AtpI family protein [Deltaproteobacteria bacterium]|jgi:ATP synthase protein I|nr:AtpZ/AtpI family protein [Deltaproteobacteria bacterium]HOI07778.1 AtpZ/AtpI family protein [Deltaproteobacteria bacterium]
MSRGEEERRRRESELLRQVRARERRHERAERNRRSSVMFGLGMIGIVGWAVAIPTLIGVAVGIWMDERWPSAHSWTLTMLFLGVILGCLNAWFWVRGFLGRMRREER